MDGLVQHACNLSFIPTPEAIGSTDNPDYKIDPRNETQFPNLDFIVFHKIKLNLFL